MLEKMLCGKFANEIVIKAKATLVNPEVVVEEPVVVEDVKPEETVEPVEEAGVEIPDSYIQSTIMDLLFDINVVEETDIFRHIEYGDGYSGTVYKFNREISKEEFLKFCEVKELNLSKLDGYAWYEDHAAILPYALKEKERWTKWNVDKDKTSSDTWTYIWVRAYTD